MCMSISVFLPFDSLAYVRYYIIPYQEWQPAVACVKSDPKKDGDEPMMGHGWGSS